MKIKLGTRVKDSKDSMTDFAGVAIACTEYLYGCIRILVQPSALDDKGNMIEAEWIDEQIGRAHV